MSLMQISRRVDYALRAAIYLAQRAPGMAVSVTEISEKADIPRKFLEKIIQDMIHAGLVISRRGSHGGYLLNRSPGEISFQDVMESVEGPISLNICVPHSNLCGISARCGMLHVFAEGQRRLIELFATTKLADLVATSPAERIAPASLS
jgi:Rrf2 family protein